MNLDKLRTALDHLEAAQTLLEDEDAPSLHGYIRNAISYCEGEMRHLETRKLLRRKADAQ